MLPIDQKLFDKKDVMKYLPHREPFLFIDDVYSVTLREDLDLKKEAYAAPDLIGGRVHAGYKPPLNHPIFDGHFPNSPILPGVIQVEMMAQASSFILIKAHSDEEIFKKKMDVILLSISNAKFRKPIFPEMQLDLRTRLDKIRGEMVTQACTIYHKDLLMSECFIMAKVLFS